jgi:GH15 family glucan-1,4-alpha-glucosidase
MPYQPIENYGIIGDLHTVALVGMDASIDYLCFPALQSPSLFAALLDDQKGGKFQIYPEMENPTRKQMYLPDSAILLTRFLSSSGICEVSDYMVVDDKRLAHTLVRRAKCVRGHVRFQVVFDPKFNYGRTPHRIHRAEEDLFFEPVDPTLPTVRLHSEIALEPVGDGSVRGEFILEPGQTTAFIMEQATPLQASPISRPEFVSKTFKDTVNFWQKWVAQSNYHGRWREMVTRSAITLKLLTSRKFGSVAAAATFGLPESLGGERNWDYRYAWVRDASFTLYALMRLGYTEEAQAFMHWIAERCNDLAPDGSLQIMYGLDGSKELQEEILGHFEGYCGSRPVRIGNGAYNQLQLDIYGELMDSVYIYNKFGEPISFDLWENLTSLINWVVKNWQKDDEGIWEIRGGKHSFLYSKLMCWVAIDRGIRLAFKRSFPAPLKEWVRCRDKIYQTIMREYWSEKKKSFVQYKGSEALDASHLLMPLVKFISPTDPRWLSTLQAIGDHLRDDSLIYRYKNDEAAYDGLTGIEGTFNMCSFWYVECLSRAGDWKKARFYFEKMLGYANHLGLYSEELGPDGRHLGNFPQAFTHLALISAAINLNKNLSSHHKITW